MSTILRNTIFLDARMPLPEDLVPDHPKLIASSTSVHYVIPSMDIIRVMSYNAESTALQLEARFLRSSANAYKVLSVLLPLVASLSIIASVLTFFLLLPCWYILVAGAGVVALMVLIGLLLVLFRPGIQKQAASSIKQFLTNDEFGKKWTPRDHVCLAEDACPTEILAFHTVGVTQKEIHVLEEEIQNKKQENTDLEATLEQKTQEFQELQAQQLVLEGNLKLLPKEPDTSHSEGEKQLEASTATPEAAAETSPSTAVTKTATPASTAVTKIATPASTALPIPGKTAALNKQQSLSQAASKKEPKTQAVYPSLRGNRSSSKAPSKRSDKQ